MVQTAACAVGTPAAAMTSLAKPLEPSRRAASAPGPKVGTPASRSVSATPAINGASGPTTARSACICRARASTSWGLVGSTAILVPCWEVPGLPGAMTSSVVAGSAAKERARACSRAPEPSSRILTPPA